MTTNKTVIDNIDWRVYLMYRATSALLRLTFFCPRCASHVNSGVESIASSEYATTKIDMWSSSLMDDL